jgi:hypothetical protein
MVMPIDLLPALVQAALPAVVQELTRIEQELAATWKKRDCTAWGVMLSDDWSVTHISGGIISKAQALTVRGPADDVCVARGERAVDPGLRRFSGRHRPDYRHAGRPQTGPRSPFASPTFRPPQQPPARRCVAGDQLPGSTARYS